MRTAVPQSKLVGLALVLAARLTGVLAKVSAVVMSVLCSMSQIEPLMKFTGCPGGLPEWHGARPMSPLEQVAALRVPVEAGHPELIVVPARTMLVELAMPGPEWGLAEP